MHDNNIAHRDIKMDNILVTNDNICKICDFGVSKYFNDPYSNDKCGTPAYLSPEIIKQ